MEENVQIVKYKISNSVKVVLATIVTLISVVSSIVAGHNYFAKEAFVKEGFQTLDAKISATELKFSQELALTDVQTKLLILQSEINDNRFRLNQIHYRELSGAQTPYDKMTKQQLEEEYRELLDRKKLFENFIERQN